jgi:hypothetical protein
MHYHSYHLFSLEGDHIKVTASRYPFPTVCKEDQATDWFNSLQNCLHWNKRERQKSFAVVESHPTRNHPKGFSSPSLNRSAQQQVSQSPRTTSFNTLSRTGTQSPPVRKSPSTSSVSSDTGQDEVFGMFYDDDSSRDRYRPGGSNSNTGASRRQSSAALEAQSSASSVSTYESTDEFESESDDDDYAPDGFTGWTDEEIIKSRYMANIAKELERVSFKHTKTEASSNSDKGGTTT